MSKFRGSLQEKLHLLRPFSGARVRRKNNLRIVHTAVLTYMRQTSTCCSQRCLNDHSAELMHDVQLNQAALQNQINGLSTERDAGNIQINDVLDSVGSASPQRESRANTSTVERPSAGTRRGQQYIGTQTGPEEGARATADPEARNDGARWFFP